MYISGTITAVPHTTPLAFSTGPNAGPSNTAAEPFINFTGTSTGFTVTIALTNSSAAYFYEAGELTVNTGGTLYVSSVSTSGSNMINTMIIYIAPASSPSTPACTFIVLSGSSATTTPSLTCPLSAGKYYVSIYVVPITPVTSAESETVTVNFGYNVVSGTVVLPP